MSSNAPGLPARPAFGLKQAAIAAAALWLAAMGATLALATGPVKTGLVAGLVASLFGSALGLVLLGFALAKADLKPRDLMQVQVIGFLGRMLLVGLGLVVAMRAGGDAIAFALGFFALFFGVSMLEAVVVFGRSGAASTPPGPDGSKTDV